MVAQCAARKMVSEKRGGSIVNVSSQASMKAIAEHAFYAASKAGMDMMTKVMALELGKHNVRQHMQFAPCLIRDNRKPRVYP